MLFDKRHVVQAIDQDRVFSKEKGDTGALVYDKLFAQTTCMFYQGGAIMSAAPGRKLNAELLTAGEALAAVVFLADAEFVVSKSLLGSLRVYMCEGLIQTRWDCSTQTCRSTIPGEHPHAI